MAWISFIAGLFVGTFIGIFVMCLCRISAEADRKTKDALTSLIEDQKDMPPEFNKVVDEMLDNEIRTCSFCHRTDQHEP